MSANFKIKSHHVNGSLHIELSGDFDGSSAWELANTIMLKNKGTREVIVNAEKIGEVFPFGSAVFESLINTNIIPADKITFENEKGPEIRGFRKKSFSNEDMKRRYSDRGRSMSRCSIM
ncbi:hypothetical protein [Desulfonema magnum]|uniref:Uncharacterized protein n=1 Tax=Desulfonema magnum TaxID=45655 RepID=A0A975GMR9_9BACT|nr:hypothetical protein [Desulfonema magnum]QTA86985.1 Uncharacterized protein dnm_030120 [Desulfonema magnum]